MVDLSQFLTDEVKQEIKEAIQDNHFKWIGNVGFFTWFEINKNSKLYIFINNLWIKSEYRGKTPLFWIRKFLRDKYPDMECLYWHREKRNKFFYAKGDKK